MSCEDIPRVDLCIIRGTTAEWFVTFFGDRLLLEGMDVEFRLRTEEELDAATLYLAEGQITNTRLTDPLTQTYAHDVRFALTPDETRALPGDDCWYTVDLTGSDGELIKRQLQGRVDVHE